MKNEPSAETAEPLAAVTSILGEALGALAEAGEVEQANRLAGRTWVALRRRHPGQAQQINALMHRLTRIQPRT